MGSLLLQPTSLAHWYALVNEAEAHSSLLLGEELESYLVFLLMRYVGKPEMASNILAMEFLETLNSCGARQSNQLKEVGDKCLLFSGLFPGVVKRRRVKINYYIDMGQSAYAILASLSSQRTAPLYEHLYEEFIPMTNVLDAMRGKKA